MADSSDDENVISPSDWVDSPIFKNDEDGFETIVDTPPTNGFTKDSEGRLYIEKYDYQSHKITQQVFPEAKSQKWYTNGKTGGFSKSRFLEENLIRERESYGMKLTIDMDFGFEKEICVVPDFEVLSMEVLNGTDCPMIAIGGLEKFFIVNYSTGEILANLETQIRCSSEEMKRGQPWIVDEMLYMKKQRTLFAAVKNLLGFIKITENGEIGAFQFRIKNYKLTDQPLNRVYNGKLHEMCIIRVKTMEEQKKFMVVDEDNFIFHTNTFSRRYHGYNQFVLFNVSLDEIKAIPQLTCNDKCVTIIHPIEKDIMISSDLNTINFFDIRTGTKRGLSRTLSIEQSDCITSLGFLCNAENGLLVIGTKLGEVCVIDLANIDVLRRNVAKLEKQVSFILIPHHFNTENKEMTFICASTTQRVYVDLNQGRKIVRKNIDSVTKMKWFANGMNEDGVPFEKYFLMADRSGSVGMWRNIFYFERLDEEERVKSVLFDALESEYDDDGDSDVVAIKLWGKGIFVGRSFLLN